MHIWITIKMTDHLPHNPGLGLDCTLHEDSKFDRLALHCGGTHGFAFSMEHCRRNGLA